MGSVPSSPLQDVRVSASDSDLLNSTVEGLTLSPKVGSLQQLVEKIITSDVKRDYGRSLRTHVI